MSGPHRANISAVISATFLMTSCHVTDLWEEERGARRLLPVPQERLESLLKHSTDDWKFFRFSNLFHFRIFDRVGREVDCSEKKSICFPLPSQFSQYIEPSLLLPFKKPGIDRPLCAALRDKLAIWTTTTKIWHDSIIISLLRMRNNHDIWLTGLLFPSPVLIGH